MEPFLKNRSGDVDPCCSGLRSTESDCCEPARRVNGLSTYGPARCPVDEEPEGAKRGFLDVVKPIERAVYLVALAIAGQAGAAERIALETLTKAFQSWQPERSCAELRDWLIGLTIREAREHCGIPEILVDGVPGAEENGSGFSAIREWHRIDTEAMHDAALRTLAMEAVLQLPATDRIAIVLRDILHLGLEDAARLLGVSREALRGWLSRGRLSLCLRLANRVAISSREVDRAEGILLAGARAAALAGPTVDLAVAP